MSNKIVTLDNLALFKQKEDTAIAKKFTTKQDILVSGQNVKTIHGESILGAGNIDIVGPAGRGIDHIVKTETSGLVDTYTITFTDGTTTTFVVTNGKDGTGVAIKASAGDCTEIGDAYIDQDVSSDKYGHLMILTQLSPKQFTDGGEIKGPKGDDGKGITSISKTGTSGLVDTYTITFTDTSTTTFNVTNGKDGLTTVINFNGTDYTCDSSGKVTIPAADLATLISTNTTVTSLQSTVSAMQNTITSLQTAVGSLQALVGNTTFASLTEIEEIASSGSEEPAGE